MGRSAPSFDTCRCCGKRMTVAGFARVGHWRKHCRQGLATESTGPDGRPLFTMTAEGRAQADEVAALRVELRAAFDTHDQAGDNDEQFRAAMDEITRLEDAIRAISERA